MAYFFEECDRKFTAEHLYTSAHARDKKNL